MSGHDPNCNEAWKYADAMSGRGIEAADCWLCHLIARVRADEREDALAAVAAARAEAGGLRLDNLREGYEQALMDEAARNYQDGKRKGREQGIKAARDAMDGPCSGHCACATRGYAAIDALTPEEP